MPILLSQRAKDVEPSIRYVAVNQDGELVEMEQFASSHNPSETDRLEELAVNPAILDLVTRRGDLDLDGANYVIIRYGKQFQGIFKFGKEYVSIGIKADEDPIKIVEKARATLVAKAEVGNDDDDLGSLVKDLKVSPVAKEPKHAFIRLLRSINDAIASSFQDLANYSWTISK